MGLFMNVITIIVIIFSLIGAVDFLFGNKLGFGEEFKKGFSIFCPMALSMLGMIVVAPAIGVWLNPVFEMFYKLLGIDPSIIPASLFANDMGGTSLALSINKNQIIGDFNAFIVSSMMGCMISFTLPFSLGVVKTEQHKELFLGFICGIVTIPIGCFVAGLLCHVGILALIINLLPLLIISVVLCVCLVLFPKACIKGLTAFGFIIKSIAIFGLMAAIFTFLTKIQISKNFDTLENAAFICVNACVTLSGMLPLMHLVSKLLNKPLSKLCLKFGINGISAIAFLSTLVTNATTFGVADKMNKKGLVLNAAFAVSASFVFGSHLAFTMAFDQGYVLPMIIGKLVAGICAVLFAVMMYKDKTAKNI